MTSVSLDFRRSLETRAGRVERALGLLLPGPGAYPPVIHESMRYSVLEGGKRLRGILVAEAAALVGGPSLDHLDSESAGFAQADRGVLLSLELLRCVGPVGACAAAVEMIHAYSLIHDDLPCMDDDDMRRGKPTNHKVYGEGMAVLAGDALLTRAFEVLGRLAWCDVPAAVAVEVIAQIASSAGTGGLIGGQAVDIAVERGPRGAGGAAPLGSGSGDGGGDETMELLDYIHAHKTGALFRASLRAGALIGGADAGALDRLDAYARSFGLAYQIVDDLLDVEGETAELGKETGADARRGKLTFPAVYGLENARRIAADEVGKALDAVRGFGERGAFLAEMARFVLARRS